MEAEEIQPAAAKQNFRTLSCLAGSIESWQLTVVRNQLFEQFALFYYIRSLGDLPCVSVKKVSSAQHEPVPPVEG